MDKAFYDDLYSKSFNILRYLGQWNLQTENDTKRKMYSAYRAVMLAFGWFIVISGLKNLYDSRNNLKKAAFNLCTSALILGITIKNLHLMLQSHRLDVLRYSLFQDGLKRTTPEEIQIKDKFKYIWISIRNLFYCAAYIIMPTWWFTSLATLKWGPRELPFPVWTPIDVNDNVQFVFAFIYHIIGSTYIILETIHADLGMFSIIFQIIAHYEILEKDIKKVGELYCCNTKDLEAKTRKDQNHVLVDHKARQRLKDNVQRQFALLGYVKELEDCYNIPMLYQLIAVFVLTIGNGLELIVVSMSFSAKLSYQLGYSLIVIGDMFMICSISNLLETKRESIASSLYDLPWYFMNHRIRREVLLMITGAQKNVQTTAGKMFKLNLETFLRMTKNLYSWLTLFRQLILKK